MFLLTGFWLAILWICWPFLRTQQNVLNHQSFQYCNVHEFQPKDSQRQIQVHLCHGNIAIFTWIHGYRWSSHELLMLSWRWCFAIYSPLIFPLWLYCLTVTIGNTFLCYHISHIYTVILCFNAKCWQITVTRQCFMM